MPSFSEDLAGMISRSRLAGEGRAKQKYSNFYNLDEASGAQNSKAPAITDYLEHMEAVEEFKKLTKKKALEAAFDAAQQGIDYAGQGIQGIGSGIGSAVNWIGGFF